MEIKEFPIHHYTHINRLDLEKIPRCAITYYLFELTHDGMGRPVEIPILCVRGQNEGPVFGITAAIHGNELNGIPVIHQLLHSIQPKKLSGMIIAPLVLNVPGYLAHNRLFQSGKDLNLMMPGVKDGNSAEVYAYRIVERIIKQFDFLVDLHTASFGRQNTLYARVDLEDRKAAEMARILRPEIILHNRPNDYTLRGSAADLGIPSVTLEIGNPHRFQKRYIVRSVQGLKALLIYAGLLKSPKDPVRHETIICRDSEWLYTDHGGLLKVFPELGDQVVQGQLIASLHTVFGENFREYYASNDGVVIGKSVEPVAQTGSRILHLGRVATEIGINED